MGRNISANCVTFHKFLNSTTEAGKWPVSPMRTIILAVGDPQKHDKDVGKAERYLCGPIEIHCKLDTGQD
jgi:hypothetical protein